MGKQSARVAIQKKRWPRSAFALHRNAFLHQNLIRFLRQVCAFEYWVVFVLCGFGLCKQFWGTLIVTWISPLGIALPQVMTLRVRALCKKKLEGIGLYPTSDWSLLKLICKENRWFRRMEVIVKNRLIWDLRCFVCIVFLFCTVWILVKLLLVSHSFDIIVLWTLCNSGAGLSIKDFIEFYYTRKVYILMPPAVVEEFFLVGYSWFYNGLLSMARFIVPFSWYLLFLILLWIMSWISQWRHSSRSLSVHHAISVNICIIDFVSWLYNCS